MENRGKSLEEWLGEPLKQTQEEDEHSKWVHQLYDRYNDRFTNDNNRIWATGNIFIPLSFAGLLKLDELDFNSTSLVGAGSIALMLFWVLVAENHRAFQNRSQAILQTIEEKYLGLDLGKPKHNEHWILSRLKFLTVKNIRWMVFWAVVIVWFTAAYNRHGKPLRNITHAPATNASEVIK